VIKQPKLSDAVQAAVSGVRAAGFNFIIGVSFAAVNIEASATKERIRYISRHYGHANRYEDPDLLELEGSPASVPPSTSVVRSGRMNQLLDEAAGKIDLDMCKGFMSDHANYPGSICRHVDEGRCEFFTRSALLYEPARRLMLVTDRQACENPWVQYSPQ